ncbi:MAG: hypothetical protein LBF49_02975 [Puniceicoccales bacterium]|jgi:hypothetical protein|nr:hypothetical protein [Puniceicoccales bacterium]
MTFTSFFVAIALMGSFYNATLRMKLSYTLWLISNVYLCIHNFIIKEYSQAFLFGAYLITTFVGIKNSYKDKDWFKPKKNWER